MSVRGSGDVMVGHHGSMTSAPDAIVDDIATFFGDHEVASLKLPSGWFGRPYDNWHRLTEVSTDGQRVRIRIDQTQDLDLDASGASVDGRTLRVVIRSGGWDWTDYGGSERHHESLGQGVVEFHAPYHR
ncbi:hypothetical protein GCM10027053_35960 [Intrasporangium mesophilum]